MSGAKIGDSCILGQNVFVGENVVVGNNVKVQNNVSLYTGLILKDNVFVGPSVVFTNVKNPRSFINRKDQFQRTLVKEGATIGANATIICGVEIGRYALIGAGTVVTKNVPDFGLITGNPGKIEGWVSEAGEKLIFKDQKAVCNQTGDSYILENNKVRKVPGA